MSVGNRIAKLVIYIILSAGALYTGTCCVAALCVAIPQPHLESAVARYDFLGYYILAGVYGIVCLLCILAGIGFTIYVHMRRKHANA